MSDLPLRLIAIDRPGYGLSDPNPRGTLRSHARDVAALADHLGIERFAVVGVSGGGPLAAACAHDLPDRVRALCLISAVPPPEAATGSGLRLLMRLGRWPTLGRPALALARRLLLSERLGARLVFGGTLPPADAAILSPERRLALLAAMREGLRSGTAGALGDAGLYGRPWGFALRDIHVPTAVWHGTDDQLVDVGTAQAFAAIPGAVITIMPGHGHYSPALGEAKTILADLLARSI